jgi:hypothetical protein
VATAVSLSYSAASGAGIHAGRFLDGRLSGAVALGDVAPGGELSSVADGSMPAEFASVALVNDTGVAPPQTTPGQVFEVLLHGSGGNPFTEGVQYSATLAPGKGYGGKQAFNWRFATSFNYPAYPGGPTTRVISLAPRDTVQGFMPNRDPILRAESYWMGWVNGPETGELNLYTERWLDAMLAYVDANTPLYSKTRRYITGSSMGGWGSMTYGLRRPTKFAAVYAFLPRWRYNITVGTLQILDWLESTTTIYSASSSPAVRAADGGGTSAAHMDLIAYVANTANAIPWVGWTIGRNDGYAPFSDQVAAVAAMRSAKRGFAFYWNNGDHSVGNVPNKIFDSYPKGMFEIGKGYPLFTEHSLDLDPAVDLVGGINIGLSFRNVVETPTGWACEVTHIDTACTVKVEPKSSVFTATVTPQLVTIATPMTWVPVSFTA